MSTPSLLNIPYVIKAGTLYSQIPETGAGDFTVTRATTPTANRSTRVNADGFIELVNDNVPRLDYPLGGAVNGCASLLVEPSGSNLCLQSEAFNTSWTNVSNNLSISTNVSSTLDPAGGNTADLLTVVTGSTQCQLSQDITTVSGTSYVFTIFGKKGSGATDLNSFRIISPTNISTVTINWDTGVLTQTTGSGATSQNYGNGWWRIIIPFTAGSTTTTIQVVTFAIYATGLSSLRWGAQLETGSVATSYIPTTTQAITRGNEVISKTGIASLIGQTEGTIYAEFTNTLVASYVEGYMYRVFADANNEIWARKEGGTNTYSFRWRANSQNTTFLNVAVPNGVNKIAFGYKSGDTALFLNGSQVATTNTDVRAFSVNPTTIALGSTSSGQFFNDRIRAVALYPNRLSNTQLQALTTP
jgi:hypothetical protein